jgi:G3E family GTPase
VNGASPPRDGKIPVNLLTGFLGSGKTTLLRELLADPRLKQTAVLINEFGEVGLDHHLLERIDENVVLLNSGCVCCTVRGELVDALIDLDTRRAKGLIPGFDRVVIETTGLADPFPALSTLRAHPVLVNHFSLDKVVVTIDAVNGEAELHDRLEAVRQLAAADVVAITKTDLCGADAIARLRRKLAAINPSAVTILREQAGAAHLLGGASVSPDVADSFAGADPSEGLGHHHEGESRHHHHASGGSSVTSFSVIVEERLDWTAFGIWLTMLLNRHGDRIFRVKGILNVDGEEQPIAIHGVQRLVHPPVHMKAWPDDDDRRSKLVFIVEGLDPAVIKHSLRVFTDLSDRLLPRTGGNSSQLLGGIEGGDALAQTGG